MIDGNVLGGVLRRSVPHYFYASSAHVSPVGLETTFSVRPVKENQSLPAHPGLSYGWGKIMGKQRIEFSKAQDAPLRASVARIIGAYGPSQDYDLQNGFAIPVFIRRAVEYPRLSPFSGEEYGGRAAVLLLCGRHCRWHHSLDGETESDGNGWPIQPWGRRKHNHQRSCPYDRGQLRTGRFLKPTTLISVG